MSASGGSRLVADVVDGLPAEVQVTIYRICDCLLAIMEPGEVEAGSRPGSGASAAADPTT